MLRKPRRPRDSRLRNVIRSRSTADRIRFLHRSAAGNRGGRLRRRQPVYDATGGSSTTGPPRPTGIGAGHRVLLAPTTGCPPTRRADLPRDRRAPGAISGLPTAEPEQLRSALRATPTTCSPPRRSCSRPPWSIPPPEDANSWLARRKAELGIESQANQTGEVTISRDIEIGGQNRFQERSSGSSPG